jgi:hypothetical protein
MARYKAHQMSRLDRGVRPTVVATGTSAILLGVDPAAVSARSGTGALVYNAALNRCVPPIQERWVLGHVLPRLAPRLMVLGLSPMDLNDNGRLHRAAAEIARTAPAYRDDALARVLRSYGAARDRLTPPTHDRPVNGSGDLGELEDGQLGPLGDDTEMLDRTYFVSPVLAAFLRDHILNDYRPGPVQEECVRRLVRGAEASGCSVTVVEAPVTAEALALYPHGAADHEVGRAALIGLCARLDVELVPSPIGVEDRACFADCVHLNGQGRAVLSACVATVVARSAALRGAPTAAGARAEGAR